MKAVIKSVAVVMGVALLLVSSSAHGAQADGGLSRHNSLGTSVTVPCVHEGATTYCLPNAANPECTLLLHYSFQGQIVNGVISGTWEYDASAKCTIRMRSMSAQVSLAPGTASAPAGCSGPLTGAGACTFAYAQSGYACSGCSYGPYTETGDYVLTFFFPVSEVAYDPTICKPSGLYTLLCQLQINNIALG